jgi:hypothetical protein
LVGDTPSPVSAAKCSLVLSCATLTGGPRPLLLAREERRILNSLHFLGLENLVKFSLTCGAGSAALVTEDQTECVERAAAWRDQVRVRGVKSQSTDGCLLRLVSVFVQRTSL